MCDVNCARQGLDLELHSFLRTPGERSYRRLQVEQLSQGQSESSGGTVKLRNQAAGCRTRFICAMSFCWPLR